MKVRIEESSEEIFFTRLSSKCIRVLDKASTGKDGVVIFKDFDGEGRP
ncbi:MAG TPA: hypothetical protein VI385_15390 [Flavisolibacter sp.]